MEYSLLKEKFNEYACLTKEIINTLNEEDYDNLQGILNKRDMILKSIASGYNKRDVKEVCDELQIMKLEKEATELISQKKEETRIKINQISKKRNANISYNRGLNSKSTIFSKKV